MTQAIVVFTGPAKLENGETLVREALERATVAAGMRMAKTYNGACAYVVASRTDTVKARKALEDGKMVLTYDEYVKHLADLGVNALNPKYHDGVKLNPIVDQSPPEYKATDENGAIVL